MPFTTLITTDNLEKQLDGSTVIVDCRFDLSNEEWGAAQYHEAHIPGAVHASLARELSGPSSGTNGRHPLPSDEKMAAMFSRWGIGPGIQVVTYDQDNGMYASRLWWMLRYLGHDGVAVLDGGWSKWLREERPTRSGVESRTPATFAAAPRRTWRLDARAVEEIVRTGSATLVDARAPERFEGRSETLDRVAGHIPGALNHFFKQNVAADGTMLPIDSLRQNFSGVLENQSPSDLVMYCGSGVTACQNLLALEHAGLHGARLYPGSWSEWSADNRRPVETGPANRRRR